MLVDAPIPLAILAALNPTTPPPKMTTLPRLTPGIPPRRIPAPPNGVSKYLAPSWTLKRPAISLIGVRQG